MYIIFCPSVWTTNKYIISLVIPTIDLTWHTTVWTTYKYIIDLTSSKEIWVGRPKKDDTWHFLIVF